MPETQRLVEELRLADVVRFPGPTADAEKEDLFARAWALVVPSHSEGHPWVIIEAMSAGLPVVATDTGAVAETVRDGVSGFVVPVGDSAALARRIIALLTEDCLWKSMAAEVRTAVPGPVHRREEPHPPRRRALPSRGHRPTPRREEALNVRGMRHDGPGGSASPGKDACSYGAQRPRRWWHLRALLTRQWVLEVAV